MLVRAIGSATVCSGLVLALACAPADQGAAAEETEAGESQAGEMAAEQQAMAQPDTTAEGLWAYLEESNYQDEWSHWPGKEPFYEGTEPHGMLLSTYLNPLALDALTNMAGSMPAGAIIVKENYAPDSTHAASTVMYKAEGYDAEHNDWFWMKRNADGTVAAQGRVQSCAGCHGQAADNDYVMTGSLK